MINYDEIPWAMSEISGRVVTNDEMTPEQRERAAEDAEYWAKEGLATRDRCNHCRNLYDEISPECVNAKLHERYTKEREAKRERSDPLPLEHPKLVSITEYQLERSIEIARRRKAR